MRQNSIFSFYTIFSFYIETRNAPLTQHSSIETTPNLILLFATLFGCVRERFFMRFDRRMRPLQERRFRKILILIETCTFSFQHGFSEVTDEKEKNQEIQAYRKSHISIFSISGVTDFEREVMSRFQLGSSQRASLDLFRTSDLAACGQIPLRSL